MKTSRILILTAFALMAGCTQLSTEDRALLDSTRAMALEAKQQSALAAQQAQQAAAAAQKASQKADKIFKQSQQK